MGGYLLRKHFEGKARRNPRLDLGSPLPRLPLRLRLRGARTSPGSFSGWSPGSPCVGKPQKSATAAATIFERPLFQAAIKNLSFAFICIHLHVQELGPKRSNRLGPSRGRDSEPNPGSSVHLAWPWIKMPTRRSAFRAVGQRPGLLQVLDAHSQVRIHLGLAESVGLVASDWPYETNYHLPTTRGLVACKGHPPNWLKQQRASEDQTAATPEL